MSGILPPGPKGIGFINLLSRIRDSMAFFQGLQEKYGGIVYYRSLFVKAVAVFDAELIDQVLSKQHHNFEKGDLVKALFTTDTLGTSDGEVHRQRRKLVEPAYLRKALDGYTEIMIEEALKTRESWQGSKEFDIEDEMCRLSQNIVAKTFFGRDIRFDPDIIQDIRLAGEWMVVLNLLPLGDLVGRLPLRRNKLMKRALDASDRAVFEVFNKVHSEQERRADLVSQLIHAMEHEDSNQKLTREEVRNEAVLQILAGHDTVTSGMTWMYYYVSKHPEVRARLEQEIDEVLEGRVPTKDDFNKLTYTRAVFDETLRFTHLLYILGRTAIRDCEIGGYHIPKGTRVQPMLRAPHLQDQHYPQASEFKPERWLAPAKERPKRIANLSFGSGPRACIGSNFAKMEAVMSYAIISQRWRVELVSDEFPKLKTIMLYRLNNGLPVTVHERN